MLNAKIATDSNSTLTHAIGSDGSILLVSGNSFYDQLAYTPFNNDSDITLLNGLGPSPAEALQTVDYANLNLLAGEHLVVSYDFYADDPLYNDYAFGMLKAATGQTAAVLGATENYFVKTDQTSYQMTFTINTSGTFNLLMGVADVGDMSEPSALVIEGVSIQVPAGGYTLGTNGVQLSDGSQLNPDGSLTLPGGAVQTGLFDQATQNLVTTLDTKVADGLISQDGNGLIGNSGSTLIGNSGSTLIGNSGSTLISQDGNAITQVSQDANPVLAQEGTGIISQDGNTIISQDGNTLAQLQGAGLAQAQGGGASAIAGSAALTATSQSGAARTFTSTPVAPPGGGPAVPGTEFLVSPAATIGDSLYDGQTYYYQGGDHIAALSSGKFAAAWGVTLNAGSSSKQIGVGVQLINADGTPSGSIQYISSGQTATELDQVETVSSITGLTGGGYAVTYAERTYSLVGDGQTNGLYTYIFDASGTAQGGEHLIGTLNTDALEIASAPLSDGSFITVVETTFGYDGSESTPELVAQQVGADGTAIGPALPIGPAGPYDDPAPISVVGLQNGAYAVAYTSYPPYGDTSFPTGLVWQTVDANGSLGAPILVSTTGVSPALAVLANGNLVVAWTGSDAAHAQVYTPDGTKVGSEIVGESTLGVVSDSGDGSPPAITVLADGRFLLAYDIAVLSPQFGNVIGIDARAQIFNADGTASGDAFDAAPPATGLDTDNAGPNAVQLADGTIEITVNYQAGPFSSDVRAEPVSVAQAVSTTAIGIPSEGRATDGYISGATVFADANGNGVRDPGEASATTDAYGRFTFTTAASGPLVMTGGTDTSTGLAVTQALMSPAGATAITPLSTLVQKLVAGGASLTTAELTVNNALGLPAATDVSSFDPALATLRSLAGGQQGFVLSSTIADVVALAAAAGAGGDIYANLAAEIAASPGPFDPTTPAAMQGLGLTGAAAQAASSLAAAAQALATADMTANTANPETLLNDGAAIERVEQGMAAAALAAGVASNDLAPVIAAYTGANLAATVLAGIACYLRGTMIATPAGDVAVENLRVGDLVVTASGGSRPIRWIGSRTLDPSRHPDPAAVQPVRVSAGAFGDRMPHRDLFLSPDHAVFVDDVLIPIRYLANGRTVTPAPRDEVSYWHVELEQHDIILAEGLPCESYLDTGNRGAFANCGAVTQLHPDFALRIWQAAGCAPLVREGARLEAARGFLLHRAARLGHVRTGNPDLCLIAAGREIRPTVHGRVHSFQVPARACGIRLLSRSARPAEMRDTGTDHRRLGVAVSRVVYGAAELPLTDARLSSGWHDLESGSDDAAWRWTDGEAGFALPGGQVLDIEVLMTECYWDDDRPAATPAKSAAA